jgi:hypothetical protein
MKKQRKHYLFMAVLMLLIALIAILRFNMQDGHYWLITCCLGFIGGVYIYAAINSKQ